jgi:hypothetical protein
VRLGGAQGRLRRRHGVAAEVHYVRRFHGAGERGRALQQRTEDDDEEEECERGGGETRGSAGLHGRKGSVHRSNNALAVKKKNLVFSV